MRTIFNYITANWFSLAVPLAVWALSLISLFWLRKWSLDRLTIWTIKLKWLESDILVSSIRGPSSLFCIIFSTYLGLTVSSIPGEWKNPIGNGLWTLFVVALTLTCLNLARNFILLYGNKFNLPGKGILLTHNILRATIVTVAVLIVLGLWGVPTTPLLLLLAVVVLIIILAFRDALPNLFANFQIAAAQEIKVGDYIKLESQEEGYVTQIGWNRTTLHSPDGSSVTIPNVKLVHHSVINYGHPLKKAKEPFYFVTRTHLAELTGLKAGNLQQLVDILKESPDPIVYYHTHHFLEEAQHLVPESSNDFALWVEDALGNASLAERLASVNTFDYQSLGALKNQLVSIIEEYLSGKAVNLQVIPGREFYFMKSVSVILPTTYVATDLREFVESLRKISLSSLYFHIFESRLRLGARINDFSVWLEKSMDEPELGGEIAGIDPFTYTLEGLRSLLIQKIEKHIK